MAANTDGQSKECQPCTRRFGVEGALGAACGDINVTARQYADPGDHKNVPSVGTLGAWYEHAAHGCLRHVTDFFFAGSEFS